MKKHLLTVMASALFASCGDALSALEVFNDRPEKQYRMYLTPSFGHAGRPLSVWVDFEEELTRLLSREGVYFPSQLGFGQDIQIESFSRAVGHWLQVDIRISAGTEPGARQPRMVFSLTGFSAIALGNFFVEPAASE